MTFAGSAGGGGLVINHDGSARASHRTWFQHARHLLRDDAERDQFVEQEPD
jgi:hypothetical protein